MLVYNPIIQAIDVPFNYKVDVLRLDKIHESVSGNKWFKLKYNLQKAQEQNIDTIITFGGAYSNHIAATASACKLFNLKSVGIIRGDENVLNPTLIKAKENGMHLEFISRDSYSKKNEIEFQKQLHQKYGNHYLIPEGGNNIEGVLGCAEIIKPEWNYDYILCACGTATTFAGIVSSIKNTAVIGISVLKGENKLAIEVNNQLNLFHHSQNNYRSQQEGAGRGNKKQNDERGYLSKKNISNIQIILADKELENEIISHHCITSNYSFNGYANYYKPLIDFKIEFEKKYNIPLDYIYTNKLFFAAFDLMLKQKFKKDAKILLIHSGGLQGNKGFEQRYTKNFNHIVT